MRVRHHMIDQRDIVGHRVGIARGITEPVHADDVRLDLDVLAEMRNPREMRGRHRRQREVLPRMLPPRGIGVPAQLQAVPVPANGEVLLRWQMRQVAQIEMQDDAFGQPLAQAHNSPRSILRKMMRRLLSSGRFLQCLYS